MAGRHPYDDKDLATAPRRLTVDDVGTAPKDRGSWSEGSVTGCERNNLPDPPVQQVDHMLAGRDEPSSEEDPFDFGFGLDEA